MSTDKTDLPKELVLAETTAVTSEGQEIKAEIIPDREGVKKILGISEQSVPNSDLTLLKPGKPMTTAEILAAMRAMGDEPATLEDLVRLAGGQKEAVKKLESATVEEEKDR